MGWLALVTQLAGALQRFIKYLGDKQLIDAGAAQAGYHSMSVTVGVLTDGKKASDYMRRNPDAEWSRSVRDKYERRP